MADLSKLSDEELRALYAKMTGGEPTGPSVGEDVKKTVIPSLERGVLQTMAIPRTLYDIGKAGAAWGAEKFPSVGEFGEKVGALKEKAGIPDPPIWPSYDEMKGMFERDTGPWYEAQTGAGKLAQAGVEAIPSAVFWPGRAGVAANLFKGAVGGVGGEAARQAAEDTPFEPTAQVLGTVAGVGAPAVARRARTPFPTSPGQAARGRKAMEGTDITAGQFTDSPVLKKVEGTLLESTGAPKNLQPDVQAQRATRHMLSKAGVVADEADPVQLRAAAGKAGQRLEDIYDQTMINYDRQLVNDLAAAKKASGPGPSPVDPYIQRIAYGPSGQPSGTIQHMGMRGSEAQSLEAELFAEASKVEKSNPKGAAGLRKVAQAIRDTLDRTLKGTPLEGETSKAREQYAGAKAMEKAAGKKGQKVAQGVLDPGTVYQEIKHQPSSDLAQFARAAEATGVGKTLPKFDLGHMALAGTVGGLLGAGGGYYGGGSGMHGTEGLIAGSVFGPYLGAFLARNPPTARAVLNPRTQKYLRNQRWLPGPMTEFDPKLVARLLMGAPANASVLTPSE